MSYSISDLETDICLSDLEDCNLNLSEEELFSNVDAILAKPAIDPSLPQFLADVDAILAKPLPTF